MMSNIAIPIPFDGIPIQGTGLIPVYSVAMTGTGLWGRACRTCDIHCFGFPLSFSLASPGTTAAPLPIAAISETEIHDCDTHHRNHQILGVVVREIDEREHGILSGPVMNMDVITRFLGLCILAVGLSRICQQCQTPVPPHDEHAPRDGLQILAGR